MVGVSPPEWVNQPDFDDDEPMKSIFKPSAETALRVMAEREGEKDVTTSRKNDGLLPSRCTLCLSTGWSRFASPVATWEWSRTPSSSRGIRATMMASAALEDVEHNRLVMAFIEKDCFASTRGLPTASFTTG